MTATGGRSAGNVGGEVEAVDRPVLPGWVGYRVGGFEGYECVAVVRARTDGYRADEPDDDR